MPIDPKIVEAILLACIEPAPVDFRPADEKYVPRVRTAITRGVTPAGARFREPVSRKPFLLGCLDFTESLAEEHLIVGYGHRYGQTTKVEYLHHLVGEERRVSIPTYVQAEIQRHHARRTDNEVLVFHNHPRNGTEPEWFYTLKSILDDLPLPSADDRQQLQRHTLTPMGVMRHLFGQGRVLFYLGESGLVKEFHLPRLLPFLAQLNAKPVVQSA
jgi:hypothetical protein